METWLWIINAALLSGLIAGDSISPDEQEVSGKEGESVTLRCTYETSYNGVRLYCYTSEHEGEFSYPPLEVSIIKPAVEMGTWLWIIIAALLSGLIAGDAIAPDNQEEQDHGVVNIFLTVVISPQHPEHQLNSP
ncbi:unnamed protein product [Arctogadus glacialis]